MYLDNLTRICTNKVILIRNVLIIYKVINKVYIYDIDIRPLIIVYHRYSIAQNKAIRILYSQQNRTNVEHIYKE